MEAYPGCESFTLEALLENSHLMLDIHGLAFRWKEGWDRRKASILSDFRNQMNDKLESNGSDITVTILVKRSWLLIDIMMSVLF